jgi:DnaJ-class molecular chaperone
MDRTINYYDILGLDKSASNRDIKLAYKKLALKWHPDRHTDQDKGVSEEKFKSISEAYSVLSDSQKRAQYDAGNQVSIDFNSGTDIFKDFFGRSELFNSPFASSFFTDQPNFQFDLDPFDDMFKVSRKTAHKSNVYKNTGRPRTISRSSTRQTIIKNGQKMVRETNTIIKSNGEKKVIVNEYQF